MTPNQEEQPVELNTMTLLTEEPLSPASFATQAAARIRAVEVNVVSDTHVEISRGDDFTTIETADGVFDVDLHDPDELTKYRIDPNRVHAWLIAFPKLDLFREVLGVLAEQIARGWMENDSGVITPLAAYREELDKAR